MVIDIDEFVHGYLDGILFTEPAVESDDHSLLDHGCTREDFAPEAIAEIRTECEDFIAANEQDLADYCHLRGGVRCAPDSFGRSYYSAYECAGTDFWLSRNGHGAGFFDRGSEPVFRRLQDAARVYGSANVYYDGARILTN